MSQEPKQIGARAPKQIQREPFSLAGCDGILKALSIGVQYNEIKGTIDVLGDLPYIQSAQQSKRLDTLATIIYSDYRGVFVGCTMENVWKFLEIIAYDMPYNPVLNAIILQKWDGIDRISQAYRILGIDADDELSRILVRKWLHQGISLLENNDKNPYGADGVLVLCGAGGLGKTSFFRKLAINQEWFGEGEKIKQFDKDTARRVITKWIAELGEVESTLKGDIADLKAFITSGCDEFRLPYARTDTIKPRLTNICATCNSTDFLVDQTGNRRFWTVPVKKIDLDALRKFDALQLWAQVYQLYGDDKQGFRLTPDERAQLEERNGAHTVRIPAEDEILDILSEAKEHPEWWQDTTITNFMGCYPSLQKYSAQKVSKALKKLGYETELKRDKDGVRRYIRLPIKSPYGYFGG